MSSRQEEVRKKIVQIYLNNRDASYKTIAKQVKTSYATVRRTIIRFCKDNTIERKQGTGKKTGVRDKDLEKKVLKCLKRNPNLSLRDLAKKYNTNHVQILRIKRRHGMRSYKKYSVPRRENKQQKTAIQRSRKLYRHLLTNKYSCLVMDDETYIKMDFRSLPGKEYYSAVEKGKVPEKFKIIKREKFPRKFMVWQAICQCGKRSTPFVTTGTLNSDIYVNECLKKRLLSLIKKHTTSTIFWPDLATCHYSSRVIDWYRQQNINFVQKKINPPNCPELRPIERYWAIIKTKLRKYFRPAKNIDDFKKNICERLK